MYSRATAFFGVISITVFLGSISCNRQASPEKEQASLHEREGEKEGEEDEEDGEGPGNPGWFRQLFEMKKGDDGKINWKLYKQVRTEVMNQRMQKGGGGILTNIEEAGPDNIGGRTRAFLVDAADSDHLFAGGISGGLWESDDKGSTWHPVNDDAANLSITYITQNPFNPDILYYCSGEAAGNSAGIAGDGIYKSTDNGNTFAVLPSSQIAAFDYTWRIEHSLVDSNTIYIGTASNGLQRSTDGGNTYQVLLTGEITDVEVFEDSSVIAARHGSGLYYSPNGNPGTFTPLGTGLPAAGTFNRIEMAYCRDFPQVMYAMFESLSGTTIQGFYASTNGGATWSPRLSPTLEGIAFSFPWYCFAMAVKPDDPDFVVVGGVDMGATVDGGNNWVPSYVAHADHHIFYFDPSNLNDFYAGNDGGLYRYNVNTHPGSWTSLNNGYNVTQFYAGTYFPSSVKFWGGAQDNGSLAGTDANQTADHIFGGDGAFTAVNQQNPTNAYVSWQNGHILKTTDAFSQFPTFLYVMNELDANSDFEIDDATWFINPFEINRQEGEQLYFPTRDRLWRTIDGAASWEPATNPINDLYAVGVSNEAFPTVYTGGTGKLRRIDNAISSLPGSEVNLGSTIPVGLGGSFMSCITVSPNSSDVIYVSFSSYVSQPRVFKVTNAKTAPVWTSIHGDLPQGLPVNWVEVSPYNEDFIVAATDFGLYSTANGGQNWVLEDAIPNVPVHQVKLRYSDNKLFVYTHGRGIWTADIPTTGMSAPQNGKPEARVYPTITQDLVNIEFAESGMYTINLYNSSGRMMAGTQFNGSVTSFSLQGFSSGMYYAEIIDSKGGRRTEKIIRQ